MHLKNLDCGLWCRQTRYCRERDAQVVDDTPASAVTNSQRQWVLRLAGLTSGSLSITDVSVRRINTTNNGLGSPCVQYFTPRTATGQRKNT